MRAEYKTVTQDIGADNVLVIFMRRFLGDDKGVE